MLTVHTLPQMRRTLLTVACALLGPATALAQSARITTGDENLHAAPGGAIIATLPKDATVQTGELRGDWREVTIEGWIWGASLNPDDRDGHDLVVSAANGENLRAKPNGTRVARMRRGALLKEIERQGAWVHVRRTGWVRAAAVTAETPAKAAENEREPENAAAPETEPAPTPETRPPVRTTRGGRAWAQSGQTGAHLLGTPAGDTVAAIRPMTSVEVIAQEGNWARVRIEGWVWVPSLATVADTSAILKDVSPAVLMTNPEGFQGRLIEWTIQFIALERAEKIRTDFYEGEPFILARPPDDHTGFVYIAVPPERLAQVQSLSPLQRVTIVARVRTGRSRLMAAPILDLIEFR